MTPALFRVGCLILVASCGPAVESSRRDCPDPVVWRALLAVHLERYPAMGIPDAHKLLQQAATGSEHAVHDSAGAAEWMQREWVGLGAGPAEPLIDTLGADGRFARVHLRPYRDAGGDPDRLTAAFVATSRTPGDTDMLGCAIAAVEPVVTWDSGDWRTASEDWARAGYPATHHSSGFEAAYRPAYRVVAVDRVAQLLPMAPGPPVPAAVHESADTN